MTIRILIAEDHTVVAEALESMLSQVDDFEVIGTTPSGSEVRKLAEELQPDIVLMDMVLQGLNGIEATKEILRYLDKTKVMVLSMHDDETTVASAVAAGAAAFLPKNVEREELIGAIKAVNEGKAFLSPDVTAPFLARIGKMADELASKHKLTQRERDVLEVLSQGLSTKDIAEKLFVAEETVKTHLTHIYQKLGVSDRVQAVAYALRHGLVR